MHALYCAVIVKELDHETEKNCQTFEFPDIKPGQISVPLERKCNGLSDVQVNAVFAPDIWPEFDQEQNIIRRISY